MDKIDKDIEKIKLARMKPEDRFIYKSFSKLNIEYDDKYPDMIFYFKNNKLFAKYNIKSKYFIYNYKIFKKLTYEYNMDYYMIQNKINENILHILNIKIIYNFFSKIILKNDNFSC
jgi:hypothetical protein